MAEWINPDRGEMFFARRVIFVEGETEKVLIPYIAQKLGRFDADISIIDCGAKHNLPLYITIAKAFGIPYLVIHDEDPLPDPIPEEWNADKRREKERTFKLNEQIGQLVEAPLGKVEMFSPDFERACGVSISQGEKKGKALAALEHFESLPVADIPEALNTVVTASYPAV
jgi:CRISPR-associated exonuclease Cas4